MRAALRAFANLRHFPNYLRQRRKFLRLGGTINRRYMILSDYTDAAGVAKGHYFHQDLLVASLVHNHAPKRHIDVGSRIDGFVAHVAAFRPIEVIDIRPLAETGHPNIQFLQADLTEHRSLPIADSVSCLHALEHFGLGRYGDPIDPMGHRKGFESLTRMVSEGGRLYVSFPIGRSNSVAFNAHRIFHPSELLNWLPANLTLEGFSFVDDAGRLHRDAQIKEAEGLRYGCGIYYLHKANGGSDFLQRPVDL